MTAAPATPCPVCGYRPSEHRPAGENDLWECSHIECPNRKRLTAAPSQGPREPREYHPWRRQSR